MADWLVLRLAHGQDAPVTWMPADAYGQPQGAPESGTLEQAADAARGRQVAAVVPSSDVLITDVELPIKGGGVRAQQVVPFALEEQLAADIDTLHFAIGARDEASGRTSVAVVTRVLMDRWLLALRSVGLEPTAVCTEAALLPDNPGHVVVMLENDTLCLRRAGQSAQALPALDISAALLAALGEQLAAGDLIFYVSPEDWQRRASEVEALRMQCASLKVQLLNFGPLPLLSPQLASAGYLNLLSSDYAPARALGAGLSRWRLAASLAAALLAVHLIGLTLQLRQQHRTEQVLDSAIAQIARRALPGDPGGGEVRERIERALVSGSGGSSGLMPALATLSGALQTAAGTTLESLTYQDDALDLKVRAPDAERLEQVDQSLRGNGWRADLTSGSAAGSAYEGHIRASAPGASGGNH